MFRRSLSRGGDVARARLRAIVGEVVVPRRLARQPDPKPQPSPLPDTNAFEADELSVPPELVMQPSAARSLLVLVGAGLLIAVILLVLNWPRGGAAPSAVAPSILGPTATSNPLGSPTPSTSSTRVVVDVAGAVRHPGVRRLPAGSRIIDALHAAGGPTRHADTTSLNLAQLLTDGEQILVPVAQHVGGTPPASASTPSSGSAGTLVNINTASVEELDGLPGIGPVLAQAIVDYRTQNGPFTSLDQLMDVSGIGDATYADLQSLVTL